MNLTKDPLFLTGSALLAITFGRAGTLVVGLVYVILALAPNLR